MKRSTRLVLLIGVLLAVGAFVGVILLVNQKQQPVVGPPTSLPTVYAKTDIPLGTIITQDMVEARNLDVNVRPTTAYGDVGEVIGMTVRTDVKSGALLAPDVFTAGAGTGQDVAALLAPGLRAISVIVDQDTGVGTLINVGDRVDMIVGFTGPDEFPVASTDPTTHLVGPILGMNNTSTKVILQDMQVIGTLQAGASSTTGAQASQAPTTGTSLTEQQELVILAVTPQQAEVIKFAQLSGQISLVLRSPKDFVDANGKPVVPPPDTTSGIVLKTLIDQFGVLPPQVIQAASPSPTP